MASLALCLQPLRPYTHMMMASIPGAPLPDTLPSDSFLCTAKESRGAATTSGLWVWVGRCYAQHGAEILRRRSGCLRQRRCSKDRRRQAAARVQNDPQRCRLHDPRVERQESAEHIVLRVRQQFQTHVAIQGPRPEAMRRREEDGVSEVTAS